MNNRLPLYILGVLVIVALMWRVANPPAPPLPGPAGSIPQWSSAARIGDMGPAGVNPSGTMWAGAWNETDNRGVIRSALVVIDFEKKTAQHVRLGEGYAASSLFWRGGNELCVLLVDSLDPTLITKSRLAACTLRGGSCKLDKASLPVDVASILAWPVKSDRFVARLAGTPLKIAVLHETGRQVGELIAMNAPDDAQFYRLAALGPDGTSCVLAVEKSKLGGTQAFYLADAKTGTAKELFTSREVPGMVEGLWHSKAGVLIAAAELGKFASVRYDLGTGQLATVAPDKGALDIAKSWPDAPKDMLFATFKGCYRLDLGTGKTTRLIEFDMSDKQTVIWRTEIQDGRLYPTRDGSFASISYRANMVDIRIVRKDGESAQPLLPRR